MRWAQRRPVAKEYQASAAMRHGPAFRDAWAMLAPHHDDAAPVTPSLRVRSDPGFRHPTDRQPASPSGILTTLRQIEDDVAAYVCRNDMRTRVRGFIWEALARLSCRADVGGIVINSHSNGTVVSYDVLRSLPLPMADKVRAYITAGAALRKYVDLFCWGNEAGSIQQVPRWRNYWDAADPVADPLDQPSVWRRTTADPPPADGPSLFEYVDPNSGEATSIPIEDVQVDNVKNSRGSGLRAHNYWDNESEFVQPLARLLAELAGGEVQQGGNQGQ